MDRVLTPRGEQRRVQLVDAATQCFAARGYQATSISDIVDSIGVGKGVFYWYFTSKRELFGNILTEGMTDLRLAQLAAVSDSDDPLVRIPAGIRAAVEWAAANQQLASLFEFAHRDATFGAHARRLRELLIEDAVAELRQATAMGAIPDGNADSLARCLLAVTEALTTQGIRREGRPAAEVADEVVRFCLEGIGAAEASGHRGASAAPQSAS
ncbi:MAG: TetR/AcrR family transcriptional regulator [Microthrixaceae bacterium]